MLEGTLFSSLMDPWCNARLISSLRYSNTHNPILVWLVFIHWAWRRKHEVTRHLLSGLHCIECPDLLFRSVTWIWLVVRSQRGVESDWHQWGADVISCLKWVSPFFSLWFADWSVPRLLTVHRSPEPEASQMCLCQLWLSDYICMTAFIILNHSYA